MGYFGKIVKNAAIMFAVGIALGFAAPALAGLVGIANPVTSVLWNGAFFGGFGALHAAIEPIINSITGDRARHTIEHKSVRTSPVVISAPGHAPVIADEIAQEATAQSFEDKVTSGNVRVGQGAFADKIAAQQAQPQEHSI